MKFVNCAMFPINKTGKCCSQFPPSRNSTQKPYFQRDCVTSLEKYKKLFTFLFQGNTFRKFLNLLLFYLSVFFNCQQHLYLLLFSLNFTAFSACLCESGVTQQSFEFGCMVRGAWCVVRGAWVQMCRSGARDFCTLQKGKQHRFLCFSFFFLCILISFVHFHICMFFDSLRAFPQIWKQVMKSQY